MAKRGRKQGPTTLYSVWRNRDDRLLILDGTAEDCASLLGMNIKSFYRLVSCSINREDYHSQYTVRKIRRKDAEKEMAS